MSTFTFPYWAKPVLDFYALRWPDVDEDQVAEFGQQIQQLANDTFIFTLTVSGALKTLAGEAQSQALTSLADDWREVSTGTVEPICDTVGSCAVTSTLVAANSITAYKGSVLGILTINVGTDIACIATGVGTVAVAAKKVLVRQILEQAMEELARHTAAWVLQQFHDAVEEAVFQPLERIAQDVVDEVSASSARVLSMAVPVPGVAQAVGALGALYIDYEDVIEAVRRIKTAYSRMSGSASELAKWSKGKGYTEPSARIGPFDSIVSDAVKGSFDWVGDMVAGTVDQIGQNILEQIVDVVLQTYLKYEEADAELGRRVQELRTELSIPPRSAPFLIDRSTRPKPIAVVDGPPPVITGVAVSSASDAIVETELGEAPEVVVTGSAESDAARSIRDIILAEAPEPVLTGPAESDAREAIRPTKTV